MTWHNCSSASAARTALGCGRPAKYITTVDQNIGWSQRPLIRPVSPWEWQPLDNCVNSWMSKWCCPSVWHEQLTSSETFTLKCIIADMPQASKDSIVLNLNTARCSSNLEQVHDCGLFAIATATAICNGQVLCMLEFYQFLMQKHLLQCFQNGAVLPFPSLSIAARSLKSWRKKWLKFRLPYTGREMVQCDGCQKWFHCDCLCVSPGVIRRSTVPLYVLKQSECIRSMCEF